MARIRRFVTDALTYNRAAILRNAWAYARQLAEECSTAPAPFRRITTARAELSWCLKRAWREAQAEREIALWVAERDAAPATTVSPIAAAEVALVIAEHADTFTAASNAALAAAHAQLAALHSAA